MGTPILLAAAITSAVGRRTDEITNGNSSFRMVVASSTGLGQSKRGVTETVIVSVTEFPALFYRSLFLAVKTFYTSYILTLATIHLQNPATCYHLLLRPKPPEPLLRKILGVLKPPLYSAISRC